MTVAGTILRINLTDGTVMKDNPEENFYRHYFGGRGLISYFLLNEMKGGEDPLGPKNKLIFSCGPFVGTAIPGSGRNSVGAKSPLTGGYGDSEAGGFWGAELKQAGYDAIILEGKAEKPVYIWIQDGKVEIRDAEHLWGKKTAEAEEQIKEELGENRARVAQIGVAGENMVSYANIVNDLTHFYGRTGMGAVMGSKKVKAIAVKGNNKLKPADPEGVKELVQFMANNFKEKVNHFHEYGTAFMVNALNHVGGLPTKNFLRGTFDGADKISGETMKETIFIKNETCYACPVRCKRVVEVKEPYQVDSVYGGPEYETLASLGSLLEIDNLAAIAKGNEICNAYGFDTISAGVTIAFAMECYEKGLITKEDTDGLEVKFGNAEVMLELLEQIALKKGFGKLLSEGSKKAADKFGGDASKYAMHIKGQEIPMHEPRFKSGLGIGYMVSPTGADHCHNIHDTYFDTSADAIKPLGILEPIPLQDIGKEKMRLLGYFGNWRHFGNCAHLCMFVPWNFKQAVKMVEATTGWTTSLWEILRIGERAATLSRIFNIREGFGAEDDILKDRWYEEVFEEGPYKGFKFTKTELEKARDCYYGVMGWDKDGIPTEGKLIDLGIDWAQNQLNVEA